MSRLIAIARKEFLHILRDPRSLLILFVMPIVMIYLFGYAVRLDIQDIALVVLDNDITHESLELIRSFSASGYFEIAEIYNHHVPPDIIFSERSAQAVLSIPKGYGRSVNLMNPVPVQFITDASDSNTATIAGQYAEQIMYGQWIRQAGIPLNTLDVRGLILFNPELESTFFIVPGLVAILFIMVCAILTSITIVREKETGTLEQILVSPIKPVEIIIGKVIPYMFLAWILGCIVISFAVLWFKVPFRGSVILLAVLACVYIICSLSYGILISTRAKTVQIALMLALITTMLPSVMLSGFMFPIASMPKPIQAITHLVPARYFLVIIRGIILKAVSFEALRSQIISLGIFTFMLLVVSIKRFTASLES